MDKAIVDRFFKKVTKTNSCWIWNGRKSPDGYGKFRIKRRENGSHRISWQISNGKIPKGKYICHHCDNPPCVNPDHLFLGTNQDNVNDMKAKGRSPRGEQRPNSILSNAKIREIRSIQGMKHSEIASIYGVSATTIGLIIRRLKWNHVR